jgi:hypothetical protein
MSMTARSVARRVAPVESLESLRQPDKRAVGIKWDAHS